MKKLYLIITVLFLSLVCFSQNDCGTHPTQSQIDLTSNAKGIYFLEIETNEGLINKKLILQ